MYNEKINMVVKCPYCYKHFGVEREVGIDYTLRPWKSVSRWPRKRISHPRRRYYAKKRGRF